MKTATLLTASLPYPPTVNHIWRYSAHGVYLTPKGKAYKDSVRARVRLAGWNAAYTGRAAVEILVYPPDRRRRDIDNIPKIVFDSLTYSGVWADDCQVDELSIRRMEPRRGGEIQLTVSAWEED